MFYVLLTVHLDTSI